MTNWLLLIALISISFFPVTRVEAQGNSRSNSSLDERLNTLARKISDNLMENQKRTIAVLEFNDLKGGVTNLGRFLSEELITRLYETKKFKVVERQQLNKIIAEQKLTLTGVIDSASAQKLGRVLGVDSIVFGSISDLVNNLKINARLISTETGEVFAAAAIDIVKDEVVKSLMADGADLNTAGEATPKSTSAEKNQPSWKTESHFFTFELRQCRLSGTSVLCELTITNNDRDRQLTIGYGTKMFDDSGNESESRNMQLADKTQVLGGTTAALISGVPVKASIRFEGISPQATKITLLNIELISFRDRFQIQYRNIPLRLR